MTLCGESSVPKAQNIEMNLEKALEKTLILTLSRIPKET